MLIEFLAYTAQAIVAALMEHATADLYATLTSGRVQAAFESALAEAIQQYSTGNRLVLAGPLLEKKGFLSLPDVASELAQLVRFNREPDLDLIGTRWRDALESPPTWISFRTEAQVFVGCLENELRNIELFRPVFEARDIRQISSTVTATTIHLTEITAGIRDLSNVVNSAFGEIARCFLRTMAPIRDNIHDYSHYLADKTQGFVGRTFIFESIDRFLGDHSRGYFILRGDPGIGKSALAAKLVVTKGYVHHFNVRAEGLNKPSDFLRNICAQLIAAYELPYASLPQTAVQDGSFLKSLLEEISVQLKGEKCIIVVDALDEADHRELSQGANSLYLPSTLPHGIYFICTSRRETDEHVYLRIDMREQVHVFLEQDAEGNITDIYDYISQHADVNGIQQYIQKHEIDADLFTQHLVEKSQGNFIYLRMVLHEIQVGAYDDLALNDIPVGLESYYRDHWRRMRLQHKLDWFDYSLPVIIALTVVREPVSIQSLSDFSQVQDLHKIRAVLGDFDQFIYKTYVTIDGRKRPDRYRWYHASFFDFIARLEGIAEERINLVDGHRKVADKMWSQLFDE